LQATQLALPALTLNEPAAHAVHAPPFAPEKPALHSHMELFMLARGENELVGHSWHGARRRTPTRIAASSFHVRTLILM